MVYILISIFMFFLGFKFNKALTLLRDVRQIKIIEKTVEKVLSKNKITLVANSDIDVDDIAYKEFLKFKQRGVTND